jgi:cyclic pyranopterin phosphate synthase
MNFTHIDEQGQAAMVDVSQKSETVRTAEAIASVKVSKEVFEKIQTNTIAKGDVLSAARLAGIQGAKRTSELIPLCHNIFISHIEIHFRFDIVTSSIDISSRVTTTGVTGVEMEALTAVSVASLTLYDMCKAVDKSIRLTNIHLVSKTGGKSGDYHAE